MRVIWRSAAAAAAAVLGAAVVAAVGTELAQPASATSVHGSIDPATVFYVPTNDQVSQWVRNNPNDSRMPVIRDRIAAQSQAVWFVAYNPSTVTSDVSAVTSAAAAAGATPVLAVYEIPNRDCGGASAGGAPDIPSYESWAQRFAAGLGSRQAVIILEPDSLALQSCLSAQQISDRDAALAYAAKAMHAADPAAKVYMDAGHSNWNTPADQASRLSTAQVTSVADGIFSNASNFMYTSDELAYDRAILAALGNPSNLHIVIDTSRNGNGPAPGDPWCDPSGRALGQVPTAATGDTALDALLWVKAPGEADGCAAGAGTFVPDIAYALATNPTSSSSSSPSPTTTTTTSPTPTTSSSTPAPSGAFQLSLQSVSPNPTQVAQATNITVGFKNTASSTASNVTLTIGVYDSTGAKVGGQSWTGQTLGAGQLLSETYGWQPATGGTYTVGATVTDATGTTLASNTNTGTVTVNSSSTTSPSPTTTTTTSPTPTTSSSTPAPSGAFQLSLQAVSPNPTQVAQATNITVGFKNTASTTASNVTLSIGVYNSSGSKVGGQAWTGQTLGSQQLLSETYGWQPAAAGTYTVQATVSDAGGTVLASNTNIGTVTVQ